ncbi:MAG: hypothetical protein COV67_14640 [Nitrospinae bacterium CG11_big_fil_rev_8_21_14_0_20_56_8]|nr:MAG: hypothetical protein COV67_14640 [Nitrospinae bacterium CG11_big_fil_rev_8_21_14_0_20_56_8]
MHPDSPKVLIVDDEFQILELLTEVLYDLPVEIVTAESGEAALELIKNSSEFAVIISNYFMGGMNGRDFLKLAKAQSPKSARILITGGLNDDSLYEMRDNGEIDQFSKKPILIDNFVSQVEKGLQQYFSKNEND